MATTLSTGTVASAGANAPNPMNRYSPKVVRNASAAVTSGTGTLMPIFATAGYAMARAHILAKHLAANTTLSIEMVTGPTSGAAAIVRHCFTSSGSSGVSLATTVADTCVFVGLDRWSRVSITAAGDGGSTDLSVDLELV